jgi:hypothetical protein
MKQLGWMLAGLLLGLAVNTPFLVIAEEGQKPLQQNRADIELTPPRSETQQLRRQLEELTGKIDQMLQQQSRELDELASLRAKRC